MKEQNFIDYELDKKIIESLGKLGYKNPTRVQEEVIPLILEGRDVVVMSQTGSGKTASFGIPVCERIKIELNEPQALILLPTRELCVQVKEEITNIGRLKRVRCAAVFGKQPVSIQERELKQRVHVVAGTPGRVNDLLERGSLVTEKIKYLVVDEADKMLDMGFIDQVEKIIGKLPEDRVTMLFSATIPGEIENLCSKYMKKPEKVHILPQNISGDNIEQELYVVEDREKFQLLNKIIYIENPDSCIIFCRTKENVDHLVMKMKHKGYSCEGLHGGMLQDKRFEIMKSFKMGNFRFLIATDVAGRGIDIGGLSHIINFDIPVEKENYVHRIGRTGRAGSHGKAITFMNPGENKYLDMIEGYIGYSVPRKPIPGDSEADRARAVFNNRRKSKPVPKADKAGLLNKEITKIYINAGKKKKIRPGDIVGALTRIDGVEVDDIGIIDLKENVSYVDILNGKGSMVLEALQNTTIKGKAVRAEKALK